MDEKITHDGPRQRRVMQTLSGRMFEDLPKTTSSDDRELIECVRNCYLVLKDGNPVPDSEAVVIGTSDLRQLTDRFESLLSRVRVVREQMVMLAEQANQGGDLSPPDAAVLQVISAIDAALNRDQ